MMNFCILIPLLVGLISALFGYFLGRVASKGDSYTSGDIDYWRSKNARLETELADYKAKISGDSRTTV